MTSTSFLLYTILFMWGQQVDPINLKLSLFDFDSVMPVELLQNFQKKNVPACCKELLRSIVYYLTSIKNRRQKGGRVN